jgi:hypothetical protein
MTQKLVTRELRILNAYIRANMGLNVFSNHTIINTSIFGEINFSGQLEDYRTKFRADLEKAK